MTIGESAESEAEMDRGVKIAIFVASVLSLGLGLVWDQVLSSMRKTITEEQADVLGPERVNARVGAPDIPRAMPDALKQAAPTPAHTPTPAGPSEPLPAPAGEPTLYVLQPNDSPAKLAYARFKDRGLTSDEIKNANPNAKWRVGETIGIPPGKSK